MALALIGLGLVLGSFSPSNAFAESLDTFDWPGTRAQIQSAAAPFPSEACLDRFFSLLLGEASPAPEATEFGLSLLRDRRFQRLPVFAEVRERILTTMRSPRRIIQDRAIYYGLAVFPEQLDEFYETDRRGQFRVFYGLFEGYVDPALHHLESFAPKIIDLVTEDVRRPPSLRWYSHSVHHAFAKVIDEAPSEFVDRLVEAYPLSQPRSDWVSYLPGATRGRFYSAMVRYSVFRSATEWVSSFAADGVLLQQIVHGVIAEPRAVGDYWIRVALRFYGHIRGRSANPLNRPELPLDLARALVRVLRRLDPELYGEVLSAFADRFIVRDPQMIDLLLAGSDAADWVIRRWIERAWGSEDYLFLLKRVHVLGWWNQRLLGRRIRELSLEQYAELYQSIDSRDSPTRTWIARSLPRTVTSEARAERESAIQSLLVGTRLGSSERITFEWWVDHPILSRCRLAMRFAQ